MRALLLSFLLISTPVSAQIVTSIKPVHSLAASILQGSGIEPELLVAGEASAHEMSLKPSQVRALHEAKLVIYVNDQFETFLPKILSQIPAQKLKLAADSEKNFHLWMSPKRAIEWAGRMEQELTHTYPEHEKIFAKNTKALVAKLKNLDSNLARRMNSLKGASYIVFHDAYAPFEERYGLMPAGIIADHPEQPVSAKRMKEIRARLSEKEASCVLSEPHTDPRIVKNLMAGTHAKQAAIDPEGALLAPGPELYFTLMEDVASSFEACLN